MLIGTPSIVAEVAPVAAAVAVITVPTSTGTTVLSGFWLAKLQIGAW